MSTIQDSGESKLGRERGDFALLLRGYTRGAGLTYEELAEAAGLPLDTLLNWMKGRVQRPRKWRDLAQVAHVLHLSYEQADALLCVAAQPALAQLKHAHPDAAVLAEWRTPPLPLGDDVPQQAQLRSGAAEQTRSLPVDTAGASAVSLALPFTSRGGVTWAWGGVILLVALLATIIELVI